MSVLSRVFPVLAAALCVAPLAGAQSVLFTAAGDSANDTFGQCVDIVGDVNGDGFADMIVGAWRDDPSGKSDAGTVRVISGKTGLALFTIPGDLANDHMGFGSSGAGDANGDGFADICAAADEADVGGFVNNGSAKIVSGANGATLFFLQGDNGGDLFGWSSAFAGDCNGDGRADSVLGSLQDDTTGKSNCGSAAVHSGANGALLWKAFGGLANDNLGDAVGGAGDVNGDGFDDVIAGAPSADPAGASSGQALVLSGSNGAVLLTINGNSASDGLGGSVSGAGDVDLDGVPDLIVGIPGEDNTGANSGNVRVVSGTTGAVLWSFDGDSAGDNLGTSVRGAGDVDGDGYADLVAGANGDDDNGAGCGAVRVWSGKTGTVLATFYGDAAGDALGVSVGAGGDLDGDGFDDVCAGATGDDDGGAASGTARAFSAIPVGIDPFGTGTAGCAGSTRLNGNRVPNVGAADFALIGDHAPANTVGYLLVGDAADVPGTLGFGSNALIHVALPPLSSFIFLGNAFSDAHGSHIAPVPLPALPQLAGFQATFQTLWVWPTPCPGLGALNASSSNGVTITIQP